MFVKPDNWNELTPLERRKLRLDHWQNAPVEFVSLEAEANYRERMTRIRQAYDIEPADRIIADLRMAGQYALRRKGLIGKDILYHPEKLHDPIVGFNLEFQPDLAVGACGISRIQHQIHQDLFHLPWVRLDRPQVRTKLRNHLDMFADDRS